MNERATQILLASIAMLLVAHLARPASSPPIAEAKPADEIVPVLRAHAIELVDDKGQVVAQLHVGSDGGGNLRLRSGDGTVRVKLAGTTAGSGLLLFDKQAMPALMLGANTSGTSLMLAEGGKKKRIIRP